MFNRLRADIEALREGSARPWPWYFLEALVFDNGFQAVLCYRLANGFRRRGIPALGPALSRLGLFLTGAEISAAADIGPGLRVVHGVGLVVGGGVRIGRNALLLQGVTLGARSPALLSQMPVLGDHVFVAAGAAVLGAVRIGDHSIIGAHALVARDIPDRSKVVCRQELEILPIAEPPR